MTRERAGTADLNLIYFPPLQLLFWSCNNDGLLFLHPGVEVLASAGDNVLYFSLLELINLIMRPFFFFFVLVGGGRQAVWPGGGYVNSSPGDVPVVCSAVVFPSRPLHRVSHDNSEVFVLCPFP